MARLEGVSLGEAVTRLVRRGRLPPVSIREEDGFPVFDARADGTPNTLEKTLELADEDWATAR